MTSLASSSTSRMAVPLPVIHCLRLRKFDPESTTATRLRLHAHPPAHALHAFAHHGQAHARAGVVLPRVEPLEHSEDPLVMLRPDADALILDPHAHAARPPLRPHA